ncbi:hypothetical protein JJJ17_08595 [Paracoccus caeni]|uniref:Carrier domain-containing protein n=1 Tax=Paracoccus caeni TaxID=657651 RepID=A0A934SEN9_9RHOB|nr:condensation domain-containing protein [Paracoccus caeni]MBK4215980.1 hypothetical protein [Paracoccus caeni]
MNARIQDIYPLAPGQGGLLFHALGGGRPGDDVIQIRIDLTGQLDETQEQSVWQALVARHDALRTAFVWKGQKQPLQVVGHKAALAVTLTDLSELPPEAQQEHLTGWLAKDRAAGFDLSRAPLLRVNRFRLGNLRHHLVITFHHIALDGWSIPVLLREWVALLAGQTLPAAAPFRDLIAWVGAQDRDAARTFWRDELAGLPAPRDLALPAPTAAPTTRRSDLSRTLPEAETRALTETARQNRVTLATVVQGAWAALLSRSMGTDDVVFGLARAGRPASLPGSETRVGMFLTTLPVRARMESQRPLADWLRDMQDRQTAQAANEHLPLAEVLAASGQRGAALMQSAVVFENYPTEPALLGQLPGLTIEAIEVLEQTGLPLTLYAMQRNGLDLRLLYDAATVTEDAARLVLQDVAGVLTTFATNPETRLADLTIHSRAIATTAPTAIPVTGEALPALARIWQELLESHPPTANDNFFDLGGHSLLVIQLQDRIRRDLALNVEIADLFRHATLGAQSAHLVRLTTGHVPETETRSDARQTGAARLRQRRALTHMTGPKEHA